MNTMFDKVYKNKRVLITGHTGLNWHSVLTIDECLQMTADWYKIFYDAKPHDSMYEFCTQQITEYAERAKR